MDQTMISNQKVISKRPLFIPAWMVCEFLSKHLMQQKANTEVRFYRFQLPITDLNGNLSIYEKK